MITNHRSDFKVTYEILTECNEKKLAVSVSKSVDLSLRKTMIMLNGLASIGFLDKYRSCEEDGITRNSLANRSYLWKTSGKGFEFLRTIEQKKDVNFKIH